ncbi:MAG: S-layer family protein [Tolypothrix brevis GSE-NOS-MK-07-07A]|jgi:filamentous hemagglutinin family protein|nr:S-layer family protein [Tolypothrix brevis GSE-NOS-MK-07-07A]
MCVFGTTRWGWLLGIAGLCASVFSQNCAFAQQITPDGTLPNNSNIRLEGNTFNITGGTQAGSNLFHSFGQFSIPTGSTAFFNNTVDIQNIISRVTGGSISNIDGLIRANGNANLFLINPSGIVFGQNASLNVGGSFLASTASSFNFADGTTFSAIAPQTTPLLTISVPIGLQLQANPGSILVQGSGHNLSYSDIGSTIRTDSLGLQVQPGKTLALVGGDIVLDGGNLRAESGRIELGSVADPSLVSLTPVDSGFVLGYSGVENFGAIQLTRKASADTSGEGGGEIQVQARRLSVQDGSSILSITQGSKSGGSFSVNATDSIELIGESGDGEYASSLFTESQGSGSLGDLKIATGKLIATSGAYISNYTYSEGRGGHLSVKASEFVELIGTGLFASGLYAETYSTGNAGNLTITTGKLIVRDGAQARTVTFGEGLAGTLAVTASDSVELSGESTLFSSGLFTQSQAMGAAGNLIIDTKRLTVRDGAMVSASAFSRGSGGNLIVTAQDAIELSGTSPTDSIFPSGLFSQVLPQATGSGGNLTITTDRLIIRNGAQIGASTFGEGQGGTIALNASKLVELSGTSADGRFPSGLFATSGSAGTAGNIKITTGRLIVRDGAGATVRSRETGGAGNLEATARSIRLDQGTISANTTAGQGNINLRSRDLILRRGSNITTNATGSNITGGNITIDTDVLAALENSDISANSADFRGGQVRINTQGIFGTQFRDALTPESDITARGANSELNGTVEINNPDIDPTRGLVKLPTALVNSPQLIASSCNAFGKGGSEFTVTGRGGLPLSPDDFLNSDVVWTDSRLSAATAQQSTTSTAKPAKPKTIEILPATGWVFNDAGEVTLISSASEGTDFVSPPTCAK